MSTIAYRKGDRVRFDGWELHSASPAYYPKPGVVGVYQGGGWVQWPTSSTSGDDRWHAPDTALKCIPAAGGQKIVILYDGVVTTALLYDGDKLLRSATVGDDTTSASTTPSSFGAGARLSLERVLSGTEDSAEAASCGAFTPHLEMHGEIIGILGTPTKFCDVLGRPLAVGDVVEIFNRSNISYGDNVVCDDGAQYVMGIKSSCDGKTGAAGYWKLLKKRRFDEVQHGERVDGVTYVKEVLKC